MFTPIKKRWEYLIGTLQCLIENRTATDYMHGPMAGVGSNTKKWLPNWMGWEVYIMLVHIMTKIVEAIELNQATVETFMLSQALE